MKLEVDGKSVNVVLSDYQMNILKGSNDSCGLFSDQHERRVRSKCCS